MGIVSVQTYVNLESGLMYRTTYTQPLKMDSCVGKTVKVETFEFDYITIDGVWYQIVGYYHGLAHVIEVIVCEEEE